MVLTIGEENTKHIVSLVNKFIDEVAIEEVIGSGAFKYVYENIDSKKLDTWEGAVLEVHGIIVEVLINRIRQSILEGEDEKEK